MLTNKLFLPRKSSVEVEVEVEIESIASKRVYVQCTLYMGIVTHLRVLLTKDFDHSCIMLHEHLIRGKTKS